MDCFLYTALLLLAMIPDPRSQVPITKHKSQVPEPEWSGATGQWPLTSENPLGNFGGRGAGP